MEQRTVRHAPVHHHGAAYASLDGLDGGADLGDHAARRRAVLHQAVRVVDGEAGEQLALGREHARDVGEQQQRVGAECRGDRPRHRVRVDVERRAVVA